MIALGWALLAVGGWILLSALTLTVWAWLGRRHNARLFLRHAATRDPVDAHFALAAAVLQPDLDITPLADQVEEWLHRRTPHIRPATPDKEN